MYTGKLLGYPRSPDYLTLVAKGQVQCGPLPNGQWRCTDRALFGQLLAPNAICPNGSICPTLYVAPKGKPTHSRVAVELASQMAAHVRAGQPEPVLLGTGDNFAVSYFSRAFRLTGGKPNPCEEGAEDPRFVPKDQMLYVERFQGWVELRCFRNREQIVDFLELQVSGRSRIDGDNVAQFFINQGYLALVPGKHDFYYGPERLRQLARLMADGDRLGQRGPNLLGANLVVQSARQPPVTSRPESRRDILQRGYFTSADLAELDYTVRKEDPAWSPPKTPLPWLRSLRLKAALNVGSKQKRIDEATVSLCEFPHAVVPALPRGAPPPPKDGPPCRSDFRIEWEGSDALLVLDRDSKLLQGELSYLVCATVTDGYKDAGLQGRRLCTRLDVHSPYFQYPEIARKTIFGDHEAKSKEEKLEADHPEMTHPVQVTNPVFQHHGDAKLYRVPRPYVTDPARNVVVMGTVLQGLESLAGTLNANWTNTKPEVDTRVVAVDPADSLTQMLDYCRREGDCRDKDTLILLAQMPRDAAQALNARLAHPADSSKRRPFHLVIAAADSRYADENGSVVYKAGHPPPVLVPNEMFADGRERVSLNVATVTLKVGLREIETTAADVAEFSPVDDLAKVGDCWCGIRDAVHRTFRDHPGPGELDLKGQLPHFVLKSMRDHLKTDVALIQRRDLYFRTGWEELCPAPALGSARMLLELVLWKGDFAVRRTLTGAGLKAALAESERLKKLEDHPYDLEAEAGRDLLSFGLLKKVVGGETTWYINGVPLDEKAPYSVAMTDFLAFGETGYASLGKPAAGDPDRPRAIREAFRIVELVDQSAGTARKIKPLTFETYADYSSHNAFTPPSRANFASLYGQQYRRDFDSTPSLNSAIGQAGQTRPYWRLLIDKGEIGGSRYAHNQQPDAGAVFGDTTESGVNAFRKFALNGALQAEVRGEFPRWHVFQRMELDLSIDRTQQKDGLFLKNYPANNGTLETGLRVAFNDTMRSRPWVGLVTSVLWNRQVLQPRVSYAVPVQLGKAAAKCPEPVGAPKDPACLSVSFPAKLEKTRRFNYKVGLRAEASASWIEAGLFQGTVTRPISFQAGYPGVDLGGECLLSSLGVNAAGTANTSVSACLASRKPLQLTEALAAAEVRQRLFLVNRTDSRPEDGAFLNFNLRHKLPKGIRFQEFTAESRTRVYFVRPPEDALSDPRVASRLQLGLTLPLFGGVSLKPSYTLLHYLNKVNFDLLRGGTTELKLEYRFDYRTGAEWRRVLLYGRPK